MIEPWVEFLLTAAIYSHDNFFIIEEVFFTHCTKLLLCDVIVAENKNGSVQSFSAFLSFSWIGFSMHYNHSHSNSNFNLHYSIFLSVCLCTIKNYANICSILKKFEEKIDFIYVTRNWCLIFYSQNFSMTNKNFFKTNRNVYLYVVELNTETMQLQL